jgi:hypothetical protein
MEPFPVGRQPRQIGRDVVADVDPPAGQRDLDLGDQIVHERMQRQVLDPQRDLARFEPRQVEQLIDEAAQPLDLREHHLERRGVGLLHAVEQVLEMGADRRDRRLQLVTDVGDEVASTLLEVLEFGAHPVEGRRELADLVAAPRVDADRVVAHLHPASGRRHVAERLRHPASQQPRHHERHGRGHDADQ